MGPSKGPGKIKSKRQISNILAADPGQELGKCPSSTSTIQVCLEIAAMSPFVQDLVLFLYLFFNNFLLFPAESFIWGLLQQGWIESELLRIDISSIWNPVAKSCMGQYGWEFRVSRAWLQEWDSKGFRGKQQLGTGKSEKRWFTTHVQHMHDFKLQQTAVKHSAETN